MSSYPFVYEELKPEEDEAIKRDFKAYRRGLVRCKPSNLIMPLEFKNFGERIYNMEVRKDDVWIITYPKTGTTWTQSVIWAIKNDACFEKLEGNNIFYDTWHFIEIDSLMKDTSQHIEEEKILSKEAAEMMLKDFGNEFQKAVDEASPRYIKSHLPLCHLPPTLLDTAKVVYVVRNPKDTFVSWFYHNRDMVAHDFRGEFADFFKYAMKDLLLFDPYWPHVIEAYQKKDHPNMLFLYYEDLKKDFSGGIRKIASFLGKSLTDEQVEKINYELRIDNMKKNPNLNMKSFKDMGFIKKSGDFIRKGVVGDWKNHFTPEMLKELEEWSKKGRKGVDIKFDDE